MRMSFILISGFLCSCAGAAADQIDYAASNTSFGKFDLTTGVFTQISTAPFPFNDISFGPNGVLYGLANDTLFTVNPSSGALTSIGSVPNGSESFAFLNSTTVYMLTLTGGFYRVNPVTLASTFIGDLPGPTLTGIPSNIRFDPQNGVLYETNFSTDSQLFAVNTSTAGATLVGTTTLSDVILGTFAKGAFYGIAKNGPDYEVVTVDPATAATGFVAGTNFFYGFAAAPVPEPRFAVLLAVGLAGLLIRKRRNASNTSNPVRDRSVRLPPAPPRSA